MSSEANVSPQIRRYIPSGQHFITVVKRHIIGLVYIYLIIIAGIAAAVSIGATVAPDLLEGFTSPAITVLTFVTFLLVSLFIIILSLVTNIYRHNSLIITDKETIQILQRGVFQLKVSHLSHADIEDVTSEQNGLMQTIFNYGTLHIETSGELRNFAFSYCPDPTTYARVVLEARQKFAETTGG